MNPKLNRATGVGEEVDHYIFHNHFLLVTFFRHQDFISDSLVTETDRDETDSKHEFGKTCQNSSEAFEVSLIIRSTLG